MSSLFFVMSENIRHYKPSLRVSDIYDLIEILKTLKLHEGQGYIIKRTYSSKDKKFYNRVIRQLEKVFDNGI